MRHRPAIWYNIANGVGVLVGVFLKRVTITGFKSFAGKTVLDLERGVTAVVGPNGSGKSNFADAVRWALGEQSKGRLRLADREEVVFAGTDKRPRASYAEVVLLFDNENGAFPLDLTEVEVSRRLYRSGETDYRLAGRSVRLSDIQALLAQAGFGAGTYAVIGQGMIDTFLQSPPAERKQLFDEAVGIRGPELGRDAALRKLSLTSTNLTRLRDIAAELAPRLNSLKSAVATANVGRELEARVTQLHGAISGAKLAHWTEVRESITGGLQRLKIDAQDLSSEQTELEIKLSDEQAKDAKVQVENERLQRSLAGLEQERDRLGMEMATTRGAMAAAEQAAYNAKELSGQLLKARKELESARSYTTDLEAEFASNSEAAARALRAVERTSHGIAEAQSALVALRRSTTDTTRDQYVDHALQILKILATNLSTPDVKIEQVRLLVHKAGRLLSHAGDTGAAELLKQLKSAQKLLETAMAKREIAIEHQTNITITGRSLEIDLSHQKQVVERAETSIVELESALNPIKAAAVGLPMLEKEVARLTVTLEQAAGRLEQQREQAHLVSSSTNNARIQAELATALERAKTTLAGAVAEQARLKQALSEAVYAIEDTQAQARAWGVPAIAQKADETIEELSSQLIRTEASLDAHVAVSKDQNAEYEEVGARHSELVAQITDLECAQDNLQQLIGELDKRIRERFKTNFARLAEQFTRYFTQLFDGGTASLDLELGEEGAYGIDIKVSPRGKRLTSVTALSGGERALAGVALLAAILRTNPSPFVVLDEIDAALDEANSTRLSEIITELSNETQLIVITHNRQTMHAAHILFGVTMNEHHVSHLLSMRLEEATSLAAR